MRMPRLSRAALSISETSSSSSATRPTKPVCTRRCELPLRQLVDAEGDVHRHGPREALQRAFAHGAEADVAVGQRVAAFRDKHLARLGGRLQAVGEDPRRPVELAVWPRLPLGADISPRLLTRVPTRHRTHQASHASRTAATPGNRAAPGFATNAWPCTAFFSALGEYGRARLDETHGLLGRRDFPSVHGFTEPCLNANIPGCFRGLPGECRVVTIFRKSVRCTRDNGGPDMSSKLAALVELSQHQAQIENFFVRAESAKLRDDYSSASAAYHEYVFAIKAYLNASVRFNEQYPDSPFSLTQVVQPLINALMVCADIEASLGRRNAAEALRNEAGDYSRTYLGRKGTAEAPESSGGLINIGGALQRRPRRADGSRDVILEADDKVALARISIDLADMLNWLGDFKRAGDEINHASSILESVVGDHPVTGQDVISNVIGSIASIMSGKGDKTSGERTAQLYRAYVEITFYRGLIAKALHKWDEAETCFQKVLPEYRSLGSGDAIEYQLAQIKLGQGEHNAALQKIRNVAGSFEKGVYRAKRPVLYKAMAECLHALGESHDALRRLRNAIADLQNQHFDPDALWRAQHLLARVLADTGDHEGALNAYRDAISTISDLRRAPLGYRTRQHISRGQNENLLDGYRAGRTRPVGRRVLRVHG